MLQEKYKDELREYVVKHTIDHDRNEVIETVIRLSELVPQATAEELDIVDYQEARAYVGYRLKEGLSIPDDLMQDIITVKVSLHCHDVPKDMHLVFAYRKSNLTGYSVKEIELYGNNTMEITMPVDTYFMVYVHNRTPVMAVYHYDDTDSYILQKCQCLGHEDSYELNIHLHSGNLQTPIVDFKDYPASAHEQNDVDQEFLNMVFTYARNLNAEDAIRTGFNDLVERSKHDVTLDDSKSIRELDKLDLN